MPLQRLELRAGVNREGTTLSNEGGWFDCEKIRFRSGYPQKIGGWQLLSPRTFRGLATNLWCYVTLKGYNLLSVATNEKYYIESGGIYYDITPIRYSSPPGSVTFFATSGSNILLVNDSNHGAVNGDFVTFYGAVSLGGNVTATVLNQEYELIYYSSNTYGIVLLVTANNADTGHGGSGAYAQYQLNIGVTDASSAIGWGAGLWGGVVINEPTNYLNGAITSADTDITVISAADFPSAAQNIIIIDNELIQYSGITANTFNGCVRGFSGTVAAAHADATIVTLANIYTSWGTAVGVLGTSLRLWSGDNFGEYLMSNPRNGGLYLWIPEYDNQGQISTFFTRSVLLSPTSGVYNSLNGYLDASSTTVVVYDTTGFPPTGIIRIGRELVSYAGLTSTTFAGCIRGVAPTVAATHNDGTAVYGTGVYQTDVDCPTTTTQILISDQSRFVIAFGCNDYGSTTQSRMLVRWSDQEDYKTWTPAITNQCGSYLLSNGSSIVTAIQNRQEIVIITNSAAYSMQYIGPPYVWSFNILTDNISIIGPNAVATASDIVYWMGRDKFYCYTGRVETLPCTLRQYVYGNINLDQANKFFAGTNEGYSEVWWFYCSAASNVIDKYVIYNYLDKVWYYGSMARTAWLDSGLRNYPMAATYAHTMVYHELGVDSQEVAGVTTPIVSYIQSSDFDIGDGHNFGFVWRIIPDLTFDGSTTPAPYKPEVTLSVRPRQNPGAPYGVADEPTVQSAQSYATQKNYTVQEFTQIVYTRLRGRQMALRIGSDTLGSQWQLGAPRIDIRPDGRR